MVKLVSAQSEADLARKKAQQRIHDKLRDLAANIMRVARGAGDPGILPDQATDFAKAVTQYDEAAGVLPSTDVYADALALRDDPKFRADPHYYGQQRIIRGSLQMAASELLGQRTQVAAGHNEMYDGIIMIEAARAETKKIPKRTKPRR